MKNFFKSRKISPFKVVIIYLLIAALGAFAVYGAFTYSTLKRISKANVTVKSNPSGKTDSNYELIALFATQRKEESYILWPEPNADLNRGFTKSMMVYARDKNTGDVRLLSLRKDILADITDYGFDRIEKSYQIGTSALQLDMLNKKLGLNIDKFITFNFDTVEYLVNALRTIEVHVDQKDIPLLNSEVAKYRNDRPTTAFDVPQGGNVRLNGIQAQVYMQLPIDKTDELSYNLRANKILRGVMARLRELEPTTVPFSLSYMADYMYTNLSNKEMASFLYHLNDCKSLEYANVPTDTHIYPIRYYIPERWYLPYDEEITVKQSQSFIFDGLKP